MAERQSRHNRQLPSHGGREAPSRTADPSLWDEPPATIRDDEEEVHDLGFIVDDHDDRSNDLLEPWQRLDTLDTDEPLETNRRTPLPAEAAELSRRGLAPELYASDFHDEHAAAEADEEEFATENRLLVDPYEEGLTTVPEDDEDPNADMDRDGRLETVDIRGHAPGIAGGFGSDVPQDVGREGFAVRDNPLSVPVEELDYPISTEPLSDEAIGIRDVDEMGSEEALNRLADRGAALEEHPTRRRNRRQAGS